MLAAYTAIGGGSTGGSAFLAGVSAFLVFSAAWTPGTRAVNAGGHRQDQHATEGDRAVSHVGNLSRRRVAVQAFAGSREKGDRHHLCEAPSGPFRQMVPVTFFPPSIIRDRRRDRQPTGRRGDAGGKKMLSGNGPSRPAGTRVMPSFPRAASKFRLSYPALAASPRLCAETSLQRRKLVSQPA